MNSSYAAKDNSYTPNQGSQDVVTVLTAYDSSSYFVGSMKRKFKTGDVNRDTDIVNDVNTYCVIYGPELAFSTFSQSQTFCFNFTLGTEYLSNFRETSDTAVTVQDYVAPTNNVAVVDGKNS